MAKKKYTYPPEFYETGTLPTREEAESQCSDAFLKKLEERMIAAKKIVAKARKAQSIKR